MAQTVKNLPAMRETWVWFLGWEDPLKKGVATHSSILTWRIPWTGDPSWLTVHVVTKSQTGLSDFRFLYEMSISEKVMVLLNIHTVVLNIHTVVSWHILFAFFG